jgi:hypothetical protein
VAPWPTSPLGVLLGFTGPLESITPHMADGAELAFRRDQRQRQVLGGTTITPVRADRAASIRPWRRLRPSV